MNLILNMTAIFVAFYYSVIRMQIDLSFSNHNVKSFLGTKNNYNREEMKNIILTLTLGSTLLLTGCVTTTPAKTKVEAQEMATELAQNHDGLEALISSGVKINFRRFQYSPVVLFESVFGDFNVSKQAYKKGYGDLLNLDLGSLPNTTCGDANSSTIDHSTKCRITKTTYDNAVTFMGTKRAYDNSKDSLDKIYSELNKIDAFLKPMSVEERQFWGAAFVDEMKGRFTDVEFIIALQRYSSAPNEKYAEMLAYGKAQFEKEKAERLLEQKMKLAYEKQQKEARDLIKKQDEEKRVELQEYNSTQRVTWSLRHSASYSPGDIVCTADNEFGYVENSNSKNTKVLIKGVAHSKPNMFFFGNFDQNVGTSFRTVVYEEMKWFSKSDIASCQIKI